MARRLKVHPYLDSEELEKRYRNAQDAVERSQWQIVWLLSVGKTSAEVAAVTGYCVDWIRKIVRRYNTGGPAAVCDRGHRNSGPQRVLDGVQEAELETEVGKATATTEVLSGVQVSA